MEWIDTHCHLDAPEFARLGGASAVREAARALGVAHCVLPAVEPGNWQAVRDLAHAHGDSYALGIHPLYVGRCTQADLDALADALHQWRDDPRLVAVGEAGLDHFEPAVCTPDMRAWQAQVLAAQLRLARRLDLPVLLHVRRSVDAVLAQLRRCAPGPAGAQARLQGPTPWRGIAHAFNGSLEQAARMAALGLKLGFGGALSFERALQLRRLAQAVAPDGWVLETDAPDMPPQWLYQRASERAQGGPPTPNSPAQLPRIAQVWAQLRAMPLEQAARDNRANACAALPRLGRLLGAAPRGAGVGR
ncbi:MAG: TatD family hydrolase [Rhodoferax sp.]